MTGTLVEASAAASSRLAGVRVLFVLPTLGRGGAERQALLLARQMQSKEGASVHIVGLGPREMSTTIVSDLVSAGLSHEHFVLDGREGRRGTQLRDLWRFVRLLRRHRPDVLLPYCMYPNIVAALTWKVGGARACIWNQRDEGRARILPWVERRAVAQVTRFVSNSSHGAAFLTDVLGVPPRLVEVIHNGVECLPPPTHSEWRRRLGLDESAFVACMVANLHGYKDHSTLIAAWRRVVDGLGAHGQAAHLLLAGAEGDRAQAVREQIQGMGLAGSIHLLGVVTDVRELLAAVDLAVFSSANEGLPNAVLEAMAAGLAVVATDYPGVREAVGPAGLALLARPESPDDMAGKILTAAADPALRRAMGDAGHNRVTGEFTVERLTTSTIGVIRRELGLIQTLQ